MWRWRGWWRRRRWGLLDDEEGRFKDGEWSLGLGLWLGLGNCHEVMAYGSLTLLRMDLYPLLTFKCANSMCFSSLFYLEESREGGTEHGNRLVFVTATSRLPMYQSHALIPLNWY